MIVCISGKQRSGKDTFAQYLQEHLPTFRITPLAKALKQQYAKEKGLREDDVEAQKDHIRGELIRLGLERRRLDPRYWVDKVLAIPGHKIITDLRFKDEYRAFEEHNALFVRVEADRHIRSGRGHLSNEDDATETDLDDFAGQWDFTVVNNDSEKWLKEAARIVALEVYARLNFSLSPPKEKLGWWDSVVLDSCHFFEKFFMDLGDRHAKRVRGLE